MNKYTYSIHPHSYKVLSNVKSNTLFDFTFSCNIFRNETKRSYSIVGNIILKLYDGKTLKLLFGGVCTDIKGK